MTLYLDLTDEFDESCSLQNVNMNTLKRSNGAEMWAQSLEELLADDVGLKCFQVRSK